MPAPEAPAEDKDSAFLHTVEETFGSIQKAETLDKTKPMEPVKRVSLTDKLRAIADERGFEVEQLLGRGGMGAVMLAKDRDIGRRVALKFLALPDMADDKAVSGLRREAERAGSLSHENIVQVFSWHSIGHLTFFAMEYIDGDNLQQYVQREARVRPENLLRIMAEACAGVAAAHGAGMLHRDLKPGNIMISSSGRVKVADFGLASTVMEERTRRHARIAGTVGFMAPEQARGEAVTETSDVYGLAATLYYALARVTPYGPPTNLRALLAANQAGRHIPLREACPGLHPVLYEIVEKGMEPDPRHRVPDALTYKRILEQGIFALSEPPPKPPLSQRLGLPDWLSWGSLSLGFVLGCAVGATVVWGFITFF